MESQWPQLPAAARGENGGGQDGLAQLLGQALQAAGMIDRRADHRKVEPPPRADIAEGDLAQMQRQAAGDALTYTCRSPLGRRERS